jgi:large subunit ribosomal protein L30
MKKAHLFVMPKIFGFSSINKNRDCFTLTVKQSAKFELNLQIFKMTKIAVIRIRGSVDVPGKVKDTLYLLKLRKKFVAVILEKSRENMGMVDKVKDYVAFGGINPETFKQLLMKRGKKQGDKPIEIGGKAIDDFIKNFLENKTNFTEIKIKPFFRLHPPKGGFKKSIRLPFPKGVLGNHEEKINDLIIKML